MSKRMIRLKPGQISEQLQNKQGLKLNAVLENGKTYFGTLSAVEQGFLIIKDTRDHTHQIPFSGIYEVIYDLES